MIGAQLGTDMLDWYCPCIKTTLPLFRLACRFQNSERIVDGAQGLSCIIDHDRASPAHTRYRSLPSNLKTLPRFLGLATSVNVQCLRPILSKHALDNWEKSFYRLDGPLHTLDQPYPMGPNLEHVTQPLSPSARLCSAAAASPG